MTWSAFRAKVALATSILFLAVYGSINAYTATRPDIPSFYWEWERSIPFVPLLILPYMSIDLFFVFAPFVARSEEEVRAFAQRVTTAIVVAGICFLVVPLKFSFERPRTGGMMGAFFDWFRTLDAPFNQLPSLHVALAWFLMDIYLRRGPAWSRAAIFIWFSMIIASTVLTFQHHVIDVIGGALLAASCVRNFKVVPAACQGETRESAPIIRSAAG